MDAIDRRRGRRAADGSKHAATSFFWKTRCIDDDIDMERMGR